MYGTNSDFEQRNVAIYARVSTEHEAQLSALENQIDWYKPILAARPEWKLVAQYIDEGITGTSAEKRPQFMQMIRDAKKRKFNMIITREVSRFARNTVDTLQYTRTLKEYGCEVFFINDNIKTFDGDGELRLTIMATLAQDESRKTSIRVKAGQQTSMKNGVFYGNGNILGYDRVGDKLVINKEQAETVRMIFDLYLSGMGATSIAYEMEKRGRLTSTGKEHWFSGYISKMLKNSFYCGIITYHKAYTPDFLKQKRVLNHGEMELIKIKGTHTPIITEEEYNRVQEIIAERTKEHQPNPNGGRQRVGSKTHGTAYGRLMVCQCGNKFNQRYHKDMNGRHEGSDYQCYTSVNFGSVNSRKKRGLSLQKSCDTPFLPSWKLDMQADRIFKDYIKDTNDLIDLAEQMLKKHISDKESVPDNQDLLNRKQAEIEKYKKKVRNLIEMREEGDIDRDYFHERKMQFEMKIEELTKSIATLSVDTIPQIEENFQDKIKHLRNKLEECTYFDERVPDTLIEAFFEKILVSKDEFKWYLRTSGEKVADTERVEIASFTIDINEAKRYLYNNNPHRRVFNWFDIKVSIWM